MRSSTSCQICCKTCELNQKTNCIKCGARVHLKCANVGLNYGNHNFICMGCQLKMRSKQKGFCHRKIGSVNQTHSNHIDLYTPTNANHGNPPLGPAEPTDEYLSISNLNSVLQNKTDKDIFAIHFNAVSWVKNFDSFVSLFDRMIHLPDIICVTETRFHDDKIEWQKNLVAIENYELNYDNSPSDAGGVAVYLKNGTFKNAKVMKNLRLNVPECESIFLELDSFSNTKQAKKNTKLLLGCTYRHPRTTVSSKSDFSEKLSETIESSTIKNIPVVIFGDMNIDAGDHDESGVEHYTNMLSSIGCENLTSIPTCFSDTTRSRVLVERIYN